MELGRLMRGLVDDLRFAARSLARRPGFAAAAVLTLALGVGATAAVYTVVHAVVLAELPFPEPERLVLLEGERREAGGDGPAETWPLSYLDLADLRGQLDGVGTFAARTDVRSFHLAAGDEVVRVAGEMANAEYFPLLGLEPALGRWFTAEEDVPPGERVVVVAHDLWRERLDGDPRALGRPLTLNGLPFTVVGVAPAGFRGLTDQAELWLPLATAGTVESPPYLELRSLRWLSGVGRLADGVDLAAARSAVAAAAGRLEREHAATNAGIGARLVPLADGWFGDLRPALWTLLAGALFVLAIACVNVADLQLARGVSRQREVALRTALGAGRRHLARHLLTESLLLAAAGGVLALLVAGWAARALLGLSAYDLRSFVDVRVGAGVAAVTLAVAAAAGLASGLAPAVAAFRADLGLLVKEGARGATEGSGGRSRDLLVAAEVALAFTLFVGAALAVQGFQNLTERDLGFEAGAGTGAAAGETGGVLTARVDLKGERWAEDPPAFALARRLAEELPAIPGVERVALSGPGMPTDDWHAVELSVEGRSAGGAGEGGIAYALRHHVTPGYFETLGIPLVAGRDFTPHDDPESELVTVVSRALARRWWGGEEAALGGRVKLGPADMEEIPWFRVVGVVEDVDHRGLAGEPGPGPDLYLAYLQVVPRGPAVTNLLVATAVPPAEVAPALRRALREAAPDLALYDLAPLADRLHRQAAADRFLSILLSLFAALALALAAIGVYGLLAYTVGARRREIGLRLALGAPRGEVVRRVVARGLALAGAGVAAGVVAAAALTRWLASRLHGVEPLDPATFAGAAVALLAVAALAAYLPARRAARVEPRIALGTE